MVESLPLGAGRMTRVHLPDHPARPAQVKALRRHVRTAVEPVAGRLRRESQATRAVATSKTFKQLARLAGTSTGAGPHRRLVLCRRDLKAAVARLAAMTPKRRARLPGVARARARQILAGAVVAEVLMDAFGIRQVEVCPWALREGILLRRLSPLQTSDSLYQIKLIQAVAEPDATILDRRRASRQASG
jgi:exopolyphosphatase / guanosine-5'-triphosphate,3'-diphosphate pyrophosphatase